ncbi:hypothetical protein KY289_030275 [Solanum tuberosum]|nr:hypothetical protein KY289_030275 [Solanum tuberosum]
MHGESDQYTYRRKVGFKLEHVEPVMHGESPVIEIELEDISSEIAYWKTAVVCYVLGAHSPFEVLKGFIHRLWSKLGINKVAMLKNGIVIVRFDTKVGKQEVLQGGIYHFDNKPFIVKAWNPDMEFTREELRTVPIWIKLSGLDFKYWSPKGLSKIGSLVGKPLMVDHNTERKIGLNFARPLVEVEMDTTLPEVILFRSEKGNLIEQKVLYDWKQTLCKVCDKYGHSEVNCRKKNTTTKREEREVKATRVGQDIQSSIEGIVVQEQISSPTSALDPHKADILDESQNQSATNVWVTPLKPLKSQTKQPQHVKSKNNFQVLNKEGKSKKAISNSEGIVGGHPNPNIGNG